MPALLTRISIGPISASIAVTLASTSGPTVTSKRRACASRPSPRNSSSVTPSRSAFRPLRTTRAPASARPRAIAFPRPEVDPVTSAVRPLKSNNDMPMPCPSRAFDACGRTRRPMQTAAHRKCANRLPRNNSGAPARAASLRPSTRFTQRKPAARAVLAKCNRIKRSFSRSKRTKCARTAFVRQ